MARPGSAALISPSVMREPMRDIAGNLAELNDHLSVEHGGDVEALNDPSLEFVDASASINPLGPPEWLRHELERSISLLCHYPDPHSHALRSAISNHCNVPLDQVVVGNGSSELLAWLPQVAVQKHWIVPIPSYGEYRRSAALAGCKVTTMPLGGAPDFVLDWDALERQLGNAAVVVLGHPNNPTGRLLDTERFEPLRRRHPDALFVVDEVFADFCERHPSVWRRSAENLMVLRSFTKSLAIPGLRLGYALSNSRLAQSLRDRLPPWSVNLLAQRVGLRHFTDPHFTPQMRARLANMKSELHDGLGGIAGCQVVDSVANWVLLGFSDPKIRARQVADLCRAHGIVLRICDDFIGLEGQWLRISLRPREENKRIVRTLKIVLEDVRRRAEDGE